MRRIRRLARHANAEADEQDSADAVAEPRVDKPAKGKPKAKGKAKAKASPKPSAESQSVLGRRTPAQLPSEPAKPGKVPNLKPLAPWEKKIARQGKQQLYDKFKLDYDQKESNFQQYPNNKECTSAAFIATSDKVPKITCGKFWEAYRESDGTLSEEGSAIVTDVEAKRLRLAVMGQALESYKAKATEPSYLAEVLVQRLHDLSEAPGSRINPHVDMYTEVVKRGFSEYSLFPAEGHLSIG